MKKKRFRRHLENLLALNPVQPAERGFSEREKAHREFLKNLAPAERIVYINKRKAFAKRRKKLMIGIENGVKEAMQKHPNFKGVLIFGSFTKAAKIQNYKDIDLFLIKERTPKPEDKDWPTALSREIEENEQIRSIIKKHSPSAPKKGYPHFPYETISLTESILNQITKINYGTFSFIEVELWNFVGDLKTKQKIMQELKQ
ncbi:MAG: hypothetical protein ABH821_03585 [archaeon]